jgi:phosphoglycolate phosphatase
MESSLTKDIRGFVFDIDGTLVNTLPEIAESVNSIRIKYNLPPHPVETYRNFVGAGVETLVQKAFQISTSHPDFQPILSDVMDQYKKNFGKYSSLFQGIQEVLTKLVNASYCLGLLSNKPQIMADQTAKTFFSNYPLHPVIGAQDKNPLKPHPWGLETISKKWNLLPTQIVFVGDSVIDIQTAKAFGAISVAVSWGFSSSSILAQHQPDFLIHTPQELIHIFLHLTQETR